MAGIAFAFGFGLGGIELSTISLGFTIGGAFFGYSLYKKNKHSHGGSHVIMEPVSLGGSMFPEGPEDPEKKKQRREEARREHRPLTNQEARDQAEKLGYSEIKDHPCGKHSLVFKKGNRYISPDRDGHKGGIWKMFNRKGFRLSTWNIDLTRVVGL